ncbi:hypothetical protein BD289DRAFT_42763 [Coniella lustricola]|uniref:Uncharacterized protein n=1 Tax=Coniella lustricola TaxID=2025994 RepID=A0A2T3A1W3_9PEZI|nr:hypothetical protein BD289DRAFT_42763 [Coniella lustricola]
MTTYRPLGFFVVDPWTELSATRYPWSLCLGISSPFFVSFIASRRCKLYESEGCESIDTSHRNKKGSQNCWSRFCCPISYVHIENERSMRLSRPVDICRLGDKMMHLSMSGMHMQTRLPTKAHSQDIYPKTFGCSFPCNWKLRMNQHALLCAEHLSLDRPNHSSQGCNLRIFRNMKQIFGTVRSDVKLKVMEILTSTCLHVIPSVVECNERTESV